MERLLIKRSLEARRREEAMPIKNETMIMDKTNLLSDTTKRSRVTRDTVQPRYIVRLNTVS